MRCILHYLICSVMFMLHGINCIYGQGVSCKDGNDFYNLDWEKGEIDNGAKIYVDKNGRFRLDRTNRIGYIVRAIEYSIDETEDYSIEATLEQVDANDYQSYGIAFGWKDFDNYYLFIIANHFFSIHQIINDMTIPVTDGWIASRYINVGDRINRLKVWKHNDKFLFAINSSVVHECKATKLIGNKHGFFVGSSQAANKGKFGLHNFYIKEFNSSDNNTVSTHNSISQKKESNDNYKIVGSATGFLIDRRGYLITNHHVTDKASALFVCLQRDGEWVSYKSKLIKSDPTNDLSIIKIKFMW